MVRLSFSLPTNASLFSIGAVHTYDLALLCLTKSICVEDFHFWKYPEILVKTTVHSRLFTASKWS